MKSRKYLSGIAALAIAGGLGSYAHAAGQFDGVTVNIMTQTGAIQEPLQRRAPDFEKATGAKINVIAVPFSDLYQKVLTDWASGTNSVDAAVFAPQWMVDYIAGGFLEDLTTASPRTRTSSRTTSAVLPRLLRKVQRQDLHGHPRWRLSHDVLPLRRVRGGRPQAAGDLGRLPRRRQGVERQGHERRRPARLWVLHRQEA